MEINILELRVKKLCFFCKNDDVIKKFNILNAPLVLGCTKQENNYDKLISFNVFQCPACELIFTDANLDEIGYSDVHSEAVGKMWQEHHAMFSKFIELKKNIKTLEIGPSTNPISRKNTTFVDMFNDVPFVLQENETYVKSRFPDIELDKKFNRIVASHVFEHSTEPEQFLKKCIEMLDDDGEIFLSIPNFEFWINNKYWNGITAEHQIYPSIKQINHICNKNKLNLKFEFFKNHSVFLRINENKIENDYKYNNSINILEWAKSIKSSIKNLEEKITSECIENAMIVGASHISQYPILISDKIKNTIHFSLDNSISKHDLRLYGTKCICKPFEILRTEKNPTVILFNSPYKNEMKEQIKKINNLTKIIEC
jgi:predicted SAM-dependent methyltransferase